MKMKRRDLMDASRLLQRHGLSKPGEMDTPSLMLAVNYLTEKRNGDTELDFLTWLDEEFDEADLALADPEADADDDTAPPADIEERLRPTSTAKRPAKRTAAKRPSGK